MPTLSSSIVKRQIASMRDVEEALARQVLYGGDLATNLLELAAVSEADLTTLLAESHGIEPAPVGELPAAPDVTRRLVPGELALRHGVFPLEERDSMLVVAVSEPLAPEVEQDLSFSLGVTIAQRAAPLVRIRQAIARDYGVGMDRRMLRLIAKLEGRPDPSPSSFPPRASQPPAAPQATLNDIPAAAPVPAIQPSSAPPAAAPKAAGERAAPAPTAAPSAPSDAPPAAPALGPRPPQAAPSVPASSPPAAPAAAPAPAPEAVNLRTVSTLPAPRDSEAPARLATWAEAAVHPRRRRRHIGPYTAAMAEQDLVEAETRDDVLQAFFDYAAQYFEYAALFAVQGDLAEGRDAHGPGTGAPRISSIGVPLDLPSALSATRRAGSYQLVRLAGDGLDASVAKDLGRKPGRVVLLLPIIVRGRCVLLLYGDHGEADVELQPVGSLIAFAPLVATALETVILKRKRATRKDVALPLPSRASQRPRPQGPSKEARAAALASALSLPAASPSRPPAAASPSRPPAAASPSRPPAAAVASARPASQAASEAMARAPTLPASPAPPAVRSAPPAPLQARVPAVPAGRDGSVAPAGRPAAPPKPMVAVRHGTPPQGTPRAISTSPSVKPPAPAVATPDDGWETPIPHRKAAKLELVPDEPSDPEAAPPDSEDAAALAEGYELPRSRSVSVPARQPQPRHSSAEMRLPSVIVHVEEDVEELLRLLLEGDLEAGDRLVELGEQAVGPLIAIFPGPITNEPRRGTGEIPRASDSGPVLRALARIGAPAVPFLLVRTADTDPKVRAWATRLLGEIPALESARAVVRRFTDADPDVRRAALAAGRLLQNDADTRTALRDGLCDLAAAPAQTKEIRHSAIEALADLRETRAVPRLIRLLEDRSAEIVRSAAWALSVIARQDFGRDASRWTDWWQRNGTRHRVEWLIDGLMHDDANVRREAGDELKAITKEYFGYYDDLPKKERQKAQDRYREWWENKGKARFR